METTLSLIRPADPDAILGAAAALMPPTDWAMTRALLPTIGLAKARVDLGAATLGCGTMLQSIACRYALDDGSAALTVAVPRGLVDMLCSLRFGGPPARGRSHHGHVEASIARSIANAVAADLSHDGVTWCLRPDDGDAPVVVRTLAFDDNSAAPPLLALGLGGARLTGLHVIPTHDWPERLAAVVREIRLPVRSVLARPLLSAGEIARLSVGDVIPIRTPDRIDLSSGGHRLANGRLVERDGHAAIELTPQELPS